MSKNYFRALATMIGSIIGAGMFAVPYTIHKAGVLSLFFYLPILGFFGYHLNLFYAEIILSTKKKHRAPGYVEKYFGKTQKKLTLIITLAAINLGTLAYLIYGGRFMHQLLSPYLGGSEFLYTNIVLLLGAAATFAGIKMLATIELLMSLLLFVVIALIGWKGFYYVDPGNFTLVNWRYLLLPYGPVFFAVSGTSSIPVVCKLLAHKKKEIKKAIFWGSLIPVLVTFIFSLVVVGITGAQTSDDSLLGLDMVLGNGIVKITLVFALFSLFTSFLMSIQSLRETYWWDLKIKKVLAWFIAISIPYLMYLSGLNNAAKVVSFTGAISGGVIGIIYILLLQKVKKKPQQKSVIKNKINKKIAIIMSLAFILGFVYELIHMFK